MTWDDIIKIEEEKSYYKNMIDVIKKEDKIYPNFDDIFNAFKLCPFDKIKVVILGQDPYHEEGQAHGLAFSVLNNKTPKSLQNIFKEIELEFKKKRTNNNLSDWANQGVLLLNTILTVKPHLALSHKGIGWEIFTDNIIKALSKNKDKLVFILLGNNAIKKKELIANNHYILQTTHPSPLSANRGFIGSNIFKKCNAILRENNMDEIKWWDNE